ncbi:MAG TPA: hypothetical protein VMI47_01070 [Pseudolabrys sp.]|nr:hypothetical protein [Pseudolabrys sp.]
MPRKLSAVLAIAAGLMLAAAAAPAETVHKKHHVTHHWHGYGFLPGYRPPPVVARDRAEHYYDLYGPRYYGPAWPRYYRGRWNGGGFGPCYTQTPIGPFWNCGQ